MIVCHQGLPACYLQQGPGAVDAIYSMRFGSVMDSAGT